MNLNLGTIIKMTIFLPIVGLVLGFYSSVLAQNSAGKILPIRNVLPARSDATFSGEPIEASRPGRIDEKAAFSVQENDTGQEADSIKFPEKFWAFLFGVYLFLLVFNLSFGLKDKKKIQWFWELLLTLLVLWTWKKLDPGQNFRWFYYCVIESGVIIYFFYAYSFLRSKKERN